MAMTKMSLCVLKQVFQYVFDHVQIECHILFSQLLNDTWKKKLIIVEKEIKKSYKKKSYRNNKTG